MQKKAIAVAAVLGGAALGWSALPANAAQCFHETIAHPGGFREIVQRCETRHIIPPAPRTVTRTTRTVTRDYFVTEPSFTTSFTRDDFYTRPMPRAWDEDVYYGSSFAPGYGSRFAPGYGSSFSPGSPYSDWGY